MFRQTKSRTWARPRRVIAKVEHKPGHEQRCRFLVTSLDRHQVPPRELYEDTYCPRGDMENRIKDCQLDLFANRMSAHAYKANQLRLLFAAFAYVLIDGIRRIALKKTTLAKAVPNTIRLKLLKVGAKVTNSVRRIKLSLPDAVLTKTSSSRLTPPWRPRNRNSPPQQGKGCDAAAAMPAACPKARQNQSFADPAERSWPQYPSQSPTHHADNSNQPDHSQIQRHKNAS